MVDDTLGDVFRALSEGLTDHTTGTRDRRLVPLLETSPTKAGYERRTLVEEAVRENLQGFQRVRAGSQLGHRITHDGGAFPVAAFGNLGDHTEYDRIYLRTRSGNMYLLSGDGNGTIINLNQSKERGESRGAELLDGDRSGVIEVGKQFAFGSGNRTGPVTEIVAVKPEHLDPDVLTGLVMDQHIRQQPDLMLGQLPTTKSPNLGLDSRLVQEFWQGMGPVINPSTS